MIIGPDIEMELLQSGDFTFDWDTHLLATQNAVTKLVQEAPNYQTIVLTCGLPASGKTTAAEKLEETMGKDKVLIYDATNLDPYKRAPLIAIAKAHGKKVYLLATQCPFDVLLDRNKERPENRQVPLHSMNAMYHKYRLPKENEQVDSIKLLKTNN